MSERLSRSCDGFCGTSELEAEAHVTCRLADDNQARNQDFMWGGANEAKVDQTTEMYFLLSDPFI